MTTLALLAYLAFQHREGIRDTVEDIADNIKEGFKKNNKDNSNKYMSGLKLPEEIVNNKPSSIGSKEESSLSDDVIHISLKRTKKKIKKFSVVIDGGFGCGKHTLTNALIGRGITEPSICPHPENEKIVINFGYDNEKAVIHHRNGTTEEWSLDDYQSIKFKDDYKKAWDYIEYHLKGNDVERKLQFTLLPPYSHDLFSQDAYINANAVIYCMNAINPLTSYEKDFISAKYYNKQLKNVFFAVTRWDAIGDEDSKSYAKEYIEKGLSDVFVETNGRVNRELMNSRIFYLNVRGAECLRTNRKYSVLIGSKEVEVPIDIEETGVPALEEVLAEYMAENS